MKRNNAFTEILQLKLGFLVLAGTLAFSLPSCKNAGGSGMFMAPGGGAPATYSVAYNGNGNTGGSVPIDSNEYATGDTVVVLGNSGCLEKTGFSFAGWNTSAAGDGATYSQGQNYIMGDADVVLYAIWTDQQTYRVTYEGNENSGGDAPVDSTNYISGQTVTVLAPGSLVKIGFTFNGWNTSSNGSGTSYVAGQTFSIESGDVTLWAQWTDLPTYTVTYHGNGNTGGTVPTDNTHYLQGQSVIVLGNTGNLSKTDYTFIGWNTAAGGSGTAYEPGDTFPMGSGNVTLYAQWVPASTEFTEIRRGFDASGVQISQRETVYASQAEYAATYDPGRYFGYLHYIVTTSEGASSIQPSYIISMKISNGAGANGIWMDSDDDDVSYVLNSFDENGVIYETNIYRDFYRARRLEYTRYTVNGDGTYYKILMYTNSGLLTGSVYFTNENGFMKQLDYWSGDGAGTQNQRIVLSHDSSNRLIEVLQLMNDCSGDECSGLENLQRNRYVYSGSNIQPSTQSLSMWVIGLLGGYWYSMGSFDYTLNSAGTYIVNSTGSLMSVDASTEYTYNGSNYYDAISNYSDDDWTTLSAYYEFNYQ
ncbi:MAG: InlB B-repeat-containing protein [Spirochaetes bacterium]|nr:InlB B-repeat-containing protein [Spirochaetota bacterium]